MTDRELIIDALRDYEADAENDRELLLADPTRPEDGTAGRLIERVHHALGIRAELEDNFDYVVRGGA